jgi:hypothetical protein
MNNLFFVICLLFLSVCCGEEEDEMLFLNIKLNKRFLVCLCSMCWWTSYFYILLLFVFSDVVDNQEISPEKVLGDCFSGKVLHAMRNDITKDVESHNNNYCFSIKLNGTKMVISEHFCLFAPEVASG